MNYEMIWCQWKGGAGVGSNFKRTRKYSTIRQFQIKKLTEIYLTNTRYKTDFIGFFSQILVQCCHTILIWMPSEWFVSNVTDLQSVLVKMNNVTGFTHVYKLPGCQAGTNWTTLAPNGTRQIWEFFKIN